MPKQLILGALCALVFVSWSGADLVSPRPREKDKKIAGQGTLALIDDFKSDEDAVVIASGNGATPLGLYAFDAEGNCLAKDDFSGPNTADDLIIRWVPATTARLSVEVRNAGIDINVIQIAIR